MLLITGQEKKKLGYYTLNFNFSLLTSFNFAFTLFTLNFCCDVCVCVCVPHGHAEERGISSLQDIPFRLLAFSHQDVHIIKILLPALQRPIKLSCAFIKDSFSPLIFLRARRKKKTEH